MKSMTGHGRGEATADGLKVTVEATSVNRRQTEIVVHLPDAIESLEPRIRDEVNRMVARGRVTIRVSLHHGRRRGKNQSLINVPLAMAYAEEIRELAAKLRISNGPSLDLILRAPGVLEVAAEESNSEAIWPAVRDALLPALKALVAMRAREGKHLGRDLRQRLNFMVRAAGEISKAAPQMVQRYREQLRQRIQAAGLELPAADDERLLKEVTYFADRSDISEELTRVASHLQQFKEGLASKEPIGRTLDFLAQELNREINTISSKATEAGISRQVVALKSELERIREQVQNIE